MPTKLPPCSKPGYFRIRRTYRCGKTAEAKRTTHHPLIPCKSGYTRSTRTKRCGIVPPSKRRIRHGMKRCKSGYTRKNSAFNRCKKIKKKTQRA